MGIGIDRLPLHNVIYRFGSLYSDSELPTVPTGPHRQDDQDCEREHNWDRVHRVRIQFSVQSGGNFLYRENGPNAVFWRRDCDMYCERPDGGDQQPRRLEWHFCDDCDQWELGPGWNRW